LLTKLLTKPIFYLFFLFSLFFVQPLFTFAQDTIGQKNNNISNPDSLKLIRTNRLITDSIRVITDSLTSSKVEPPVKKTKLNSKVDYAAKDSLRFDVKSQKVFLYQDADIKYEDIKLKAAYVEIDFQKNLVNATGLPDSTGQDVGIPDFTQGNQTFKSKSMAYNFKTKEGYIQTVVTKQDEGYLHGQIVKKMENDITYIKNGTYTTCDEEHPHFGFRFSKGKIIPGKKVITGPAYMMISEVPTPLAIPFGFFPNKTGQRSGILLPTYGESNNRGFYFEGIGYYFAISQYMDLKVQGDIYTHGSWAIRPTYTYNYRYHFNGMFNFSYAVNILGSPGTPDYQTSKDFRVRWVHNQDPKARPHSTFSANVNIVSNTFNKYNLASSTEAYLSNTFQSSINYATSWNNTYYLTMNFSHSQNTLNKQINVALPIIAFSVNQFYPFRKNVRVGKLRWYENISLKYNLDAQNSYTTLDSLFLDPGWAKQLRNGIRHTIPVSASLRVLKYFNWTNSINLTDQMYFQSIRKKFVSDTAGGFYKTDTVFGFANAIEASYSSSINTRLYGMYQFKNGPIIAIRHMLTPSVSFSYSPYYGNEWLGYWRYVANDTNTHNPQKYSIFQNGIYGGPPLYQAGVINFSLSNNLEMKIRNRKDTITGMKKIVLIEDFTIRASYDIAKDSLNWSKIFLSGYTTLFKNLRVQYSSQWDPYAMDSKGRRLNVSEWKMNHRLVRLDVTTWDIGLSYTLSSDKTKNKKKTEKGTPQERKDISDFYDYYVDFDIPWSFSINYNFHVNNTWTNSYDHRVGNVTQTLGFSGQLNITPKWKISLNTGYDFVNGDLSYTSIDVYRDLHCWEMRFGWVPKGAQQNWNFSINVKASVLQDLKLNKKKDFRDF
jgi:lipopolysaccharide assembly outer membrane protein LptD (OstA)